MFDWFGWNSIGPKAHSMPAQANGLGMMQAKPSRAEGPVYKGLVRACGGLNRAFSPRDRDAVNTQPVGLGWFGTGPLALKPEIRRRSGNSCWKTTETLRTSEFTEKYLAAKKSESSPISSHFSFLSGSQCFSGSKCLNSKLNFGFRVKRCHRIFRNDS